MKNHAVIKPFPGRAVTAKLNPPMPKSGTVYLVGAGPGDPGLLTQRGAELLARADVVICDALVNPDLLRLAPEEAEIIFAGKRSNLHAIPQDKLNKLLVDRAKAGRTVVRLKGGDPFLFARGGEEAERLAKAKVPFEIVPGITSISAVPAYAGIPTTHRDHCSSIIVLTGHEQPGKPDSTINWKHVAAEPGTKIILMGIERLSHITRQLLKNGLATNTPVALIRWGTTGRQQTIIGILKNISAKASKAKFKAPAVVIIGSVVNLHKQLNWFESRPLVGCRIVITRGRQQAGALASRLAEKGAEILEIPTIKIEKPDDMDPLKDAILGIASYNWLLFTSSNGVEHFFRWFHEAYDDIRAIGGCQIAAVGSTTAARLKALHLKVDLVPDNYTTVGIANAFEQHQSIENLTLCLLRAQVANPELPKALSGMGAIVDDIPVYKTVPETSDRNNAAARLADEGADIVTFTSGSTAENFHERFNLPKTVKQHGLRVVSIGPETTRVLKKIGVAPTIEASPHNMDGMVKAVLKIGGKTS